ncbi:MAG: rRNA pseudouridine synthase [Candidatus Omnitrophica bacterium]|nr:rRNA pseudouridine synthase [Candidatus Omnitrophota bacterium]
MRLQTVISHSGVCSRRKAFDVIQQGRVTVNGQKVLEPSTEVTLEKDRVEVDGQPLKSQAYRYVLLNKPAGYTTTKEDRFAEKTVMELLPEDLQHLHPVGRLDRDTEGLLLLTNDGELTHHLTHPKFDIDKTYEVHVAKRLTPEQKLRLERGVIIEGKKTSTARIEQLKYQEDKTRFLITIHEGRNRQVRRMVAVVGHRVTFLKRIRQGSLELGNLKTGEFRYLSENEVTQSKNKLKV